MDLIHSTGLWAWSTVILMLIITNILNPGQISAAIPEPGWVLLLLSPTVVGSAWRGDTQDRITAALLFLLPMPWLIMPIDVATNRHRTEYYDTYAVMASASFAVLQARIVEWTSTRRGAPGAEMLQNIL